MSPKEITDTGWLDLAGGVLVRANGNSCGDRTLDFFVVSRSISNAVRSTVLACDAATSPHSPVRLFLRANPRTMVFRYLRAPGRMNACLPHAPAPRTSDENYCSLFPVVVDQKCNTADVTIMLTGEHIRV